MFVLGSRRPDGGYWLGAAVTAREQQRRRRSVVVAAVSLTTAVLIERCYGGRIAVWYARRLMSQDAPQILPTRLFPDVTSSVLLFCTVFTVLALTLSQRPHIAVVGLAASFLWARWFGPLCIRGQFDTAITGMTAVGVSTCVVAALPGFARRSSVVLRRRPPNRHPLFE